MMRSRAHLVWLIVLVIGLVSLVSLSAQQAAQQALQKTVSIWTSGTFPTFSNGYLIAHTGRISSAKEGQIALTSLATGELTTVPFWLPAAKEIRLEATAMTQGGQVWLAGSYVPAAAGPPHVNFLAVTDRSGRLLANYDLGDYTPERICAAKDGSMWTFGQVWAEEQKDRGDYAMLRHYSPRGELAGKYLMRSTLTWEVTLNYHATTYTPNKALLRCGDESVVAYLGRAQPGFLWTEVEIGSGETTQWIVKHPQHAPISGMALLGKHVAYATFRPEGGTSVGGLYQLIRGLPGTAEWMPVGQTAVPFSILLGWDGASLVQVGRFSRADNRAQILWTKPLS